MSGASANDPAASDVLFEVRDGLGHITLNRPKALNALTHGMVLAIDARLAEWQSLGAVRLVLLKGAGERGFCAGGDIRALYDDVKAGHLQGPAQFFRDEYRLNARIARYAKPIVAFMDGIVMGGGIGLSAHAAHRIVTPRSAVAMPEVGIGFVPDVGGTYLLGRAPGALGIYAALTGGRLGAADAMLCGLADICATVDSLPALAGDLPGCADDAAVRAVLQAYAVAPPAGLLAQARGWIDTVFEADTVEGIADGLAARAEPDAQAASREIAGKSPTSLKVALRLLHEARASARLEPCLQREYDAALASLRRHDFVEGVRAAVVDKDRNPRWSPASLAAVTPAMLDAFFATSPETDLHLT